VYRFRGVVEGVFGGMKTRLGGAYGLRVLLSLLPPPPGYKAIY
jgi:hypothetical protein